MPSNKKKGVSRHVPDTSLSVEGKSVSKTSRKSSKTNKLPPPPPGPEVDDVESEVESEEESEEESGGEQEGEDSGGDGYDSGHSSEFYDSAEEDDDEDEGSDDEEDEDEEDDDGFEDQGSDSDDDVDDELEMIETHTPPPPPAFSKSKTNPRSAVVQREIEKLHDSATVGVNQSLLHIDDLSSDDEEGNNTIGRVPLHWYDEYDHIGYDTSGSKVMKGAGESAEDGVEDIFKSLDDKLSASDKKKFTIYDALNGKEVTLTPREIEVIRRIQAGAYAHPEHDANPEYIDYFSSKKLEVGFNSNRVEPKSRFQPSKWEALQVRRLLKRLKDGKIDMDYLTGKKKSMQEKKEPDDKPREMWRGDEEDELLNRKAPTHIAAAKVKAPGTEESYNPPGEYIPTEDELKKWDELDVEDRPYGLLVPKKHPNLRSVGAYEHAVRERFERCLDLYLAPREMKRRLNIDPESLVPQLPKARDLKPYPTVRCMKYVTPSMEDGTMPKIRALSVSPDGQWLATGAEDGFVRLWEVGTGRLLRSWDLREKEGEGEGAVNCVAFNPNPNHHVLLASSATNCYVISTGVGNAEDSELTAALLSIASSGGGGGLSEKVKKAVKWEKFNRGGRKPLSKHATVEGVVAKLSFNGTIAAEGVKWHEKGDYFLTLTPSTGASCVLIHQLSKGNSQQPFGKKREVSAVEFHGSKPFLFVAGGNVVRIYHLVKQTMVKKLYPNCKYVTSMNLHSTGDHLILGTLDRKTIWFDLDLSDRPYKTMKYHEKAIRGVRFSRKYPLMASCADDGNVNVFHSTVYDDLMRNPLIVPVKVIRAHHQVGRLGATAIAWHPKLPWIFTAGADGATILWQDI
ncbi:hypothetical protein TrCOL_g11646 [Triparma columacea]|uniref:Ribosome biogenesis protein BOP1 homolog n=1 Tax=Triparma columacea TaxID=722753 RepID=A0A9W7GE61_9STRA|nr:hypothetical protein TrCOL_g11646 [Triparma columacea]